MKCNMVTTNVYRMPVIIILSVITLVSAENTGKNYLLPPSLPSFHAVNIAIPSRISFILISDNFRFRPRARTILPDRESRRSSSRTVPHLRLRRQKFKQLLGNLIPSDFVVLLLSRFHVCWNQIAVWRTSVITSNVCQTHRSSLVIKKQWYE